MELIVPTKEKKIHESNLPELNHDIPGGFFNGASQGNLVLDDVGMFLFLKQHNFIELKYVVGRYSINKAIFVSLLMLLYATKS